MRVLFRTDASVQIGGGHLMRCLTLAEQLRLAGAEVAFVSAVLPGAMFDLVRSLGYRCATLPPVDGGDDFQSSDAVLTAAASHELFPEGVDWLVVDHYGLDARWEQRLRPHTRKIMVIDDLADRSHDCDLLLDQNFYLDQDRRYQCLLPVHCVTLLGPGFVLLRPEFSVARQHLRNRDGMVERLLVFFGSADPGNQTGLVLEALRLWNKVDIAVDVVVGAANPRCEEIQSACSAMSNVRYHCQIANMAELIAEADVGIGSGGSAMWERSYLGLPTITVVIADNQVRTTEDVAQMGCGIVYIGRAETVRADDYLHALELLLTHPELVRNISERALTLVKPRGVSMVGVMQSILDGAVVSPDSVVC